MTERAPADVRNPGRGYACIGLDNPKSTLNIGSALRATGCYGATLIAVSGARGAKHIGRIPTDTQKAYRHIPMIRCDDLRDLVPYDCVPVAVDLIEGATPLPEYQHPERAFYVFGAEDATLGARVTGWCRDVVFVPTAYCMNLAATVNVVLYDRLAKSVRGTARRLHREESAAIAEALTLDEPAKKRRGLTPEEAGQIADAMQSMTPPGWPGYGHSKD